MTTIYALNLNNGKNEVVNSFMRLFMPHVVANEVIKSEFGPQVEELQKQAARFATALENHRFSLLTEKVAQADSRRDKKWTAAKAVIVAEMDSPDAAHRSAAETINKLFDSFGKIRNMGFAEQSGAMSSLCNDLIKNHLEELELTGLLALIQDLQKANDDFVAAYEERTENRSEVILGETRDAKNALIAAYRTLVFLLNARILQNGSEGLEEFVAYANALIRQYRPMVGQKPAPGTDESLEEGFEDEEADGELGDGGLEGDGQDGGGDGTNEPGTEPGTGTETPPAGSDQTGGEVTAENGVTVKWMWNKDNGGGLAKEMILPVGSTVPDSEWPEAHEGYHWNFTPEEVNASVPYKRAGDWFYIREQPDE